MPDASKPSSIPPRPTPGDHAGGLGVEDARRIARLARLDLPEDRLAALAHDLGAVLGYAQRLGEADLTGVEPMATPLDATGALAPDEPDAQPPLPAGALARMAPEMYESFVKIPRVLGDGGAA